MYMYIYIHTYLYIHTYFKVFFYRKHPHLDGNTMSQYGCPMPVDFGTSAGPSYKKCHPWGNVPTVADFHDFKWNDIIARVLGEHQG